MEKYLTKIPYQYGEIMTNIINDQYNNLTNDMNVLFVRTPTTGIFMDNLLKNKTNITRIIYDTHKVGKFERDPETIVTKHKYLLNILLDINKKYDLICIDTYHEYSYSKMDFNLLYPFLTDNGILISHDCYPSSEMSAQPRYFKGEWSGETYIAFIDFAYHNPELFYGLLKIDTGIGIISKKQIAGLNNNFNKKKQEKLLSLRNNPTNAVNNINENVYNYFIENCNELINLIC